MPDVAIFFEFIQILKADTISLIILIESFTLNCRMAHNYTDVVTSINFRVYASDRAFQGFEMDPLVRVLADDGNLKVVDHSST